MKINSDLCVISVRLTYGSVAILFNFFSKPYFVIFENPILITTNTQPHTYVYNLKILWEGDNAILCDFSLMLSYCKKSEILHSIVRLC